ncbi:MAG: YkgJ family cysteine cluster protein [Deltaproteobacteria bacterium]|nr:YkgJ family cysteine cluster protein [Deltaproteobacteria bacterium]
MFTRHLPVSEAGLGPGDTFSFSCHSGLACFNSCCRNKQLPLTPYDVLRLKQGLGLSSDAFLAAYTLYWTDSETGFPSICLRMEEAPDRACPFVSPGGCRVYDDRPTACRLYPLGRAAGGQAGAPGRAFAFLMSTPGCLGRGEEQVWTVEDWMESQGLGPYVRMNDRMLEVVSQPRRRAGKPLDEGGVQKVIVACYNLDVFRRFVFETAFADVAGLDEAARERLASDDTALLELGMAYLRRVLYAQDAG